MHALAITQFLDTPDSPILSPKRVADHLHLFVGDLAETVRIHRNTMTTRPQSPKVQEALRNIVRVLTAAEEIFGNTGTATAWLMNEPLAEFHYKTPLKLIAEGRTDDLITYLDSIASGFVG
jgi:uncharacterized protein (DUF2384 family)